MSVYDISAHDLNRLPQPGQAGKWVACDLQDVASDLRAGEGQARRSGIRSVPDVWAQALLVRDALFSSGDPLHEDLRGQWRALLATIALAPRYRSIYNLSLLPLGGGNAGRLARLILDPVLAPQSTISDGANWSDCVAAIQLTPLGTGTPDVVTIGLAVPDLLAAPGRGFPDLRVAGAAWLANGPIDPVTARLSVIDRTILGAFAESLASTASDLPSGQTATQDTRQKIVRALRALAADCATGGASRWQTRSGSGTGLRWPGPLAAVMTAPPEIVSNPQAGASDCRLKVREDSTGLPFRSIILADPAIAGPDCPAHDIQLFDTYSLADAETRLVEIKAEAARHGHLVVGIDDLLTPTLVTHSDGSTMPGHSDSAARTFIPVTPLMLLILSGDAIAQSAIVRQQGASVQAGVRLTLEDGRQHDLVQRYSDDRLKTVERLANFGVWPDFASPHWRHYGVRASSNPAVDPCLALAGCGAVIAADLAGQPNERRIDRVRQWIALTLLDRSGEQDLGNPQARLVQFPLSDPADDKQASLQGWCSMPIEALFLTLRGENVGCVVPKLQRLPQPIDVQVATVAIDFGTSNTIVRWARDGIRQGAPLLRSRVVQPIAPSAGTAAFAAGVRTAFADFLPIGDQAMPFPTMIKERPLPRPTDGNLICSKQSIFFADLGSDSGGASTLLGWISSNAIQANIKWDSTAIGKLRSTQFLRQLVTMIGAELTAEGLPPKAIHWRLSFPSAFGPAQKQNFEDLIGSAVADLADTATSRVAFHPEGLAAKQALANNVDASSSLIVLFDIGGGTTDIAIWRGTETLWQGSFRIAARTFFTDSLMRHPGILESTSVLDEAAKQQLQAWSQNGFADGKDAQARNLIELTIGQPGFDTRFRTAMRTHGEEADWRSLQRAATTALGGMLWYVGRLIRKRVADKEWVLSAADLAQPTIALAGRGASYFQHLDPKREIHLPPLLALLTRAMDLPDGVPGAYFSPMPKQEVVDGLLALDGPTITDKPSFSATILGEDLRQGDQHWVFETDVASVAMPTVTPDVSLEQTRAFLAALKENTGIVVDLTRSTATGSLQGAVVSAMKAPFREKDRERIDTPLFILGLAALVEQLVRL